MSENPPSTGQEQRSVENVFGPVGTRLLRLWHGDVDLVAKQVQSEFLDVSLADERGLLSVSGHVYERLSQEASRFDLEYRASGDALETIRTIRNRQETSLQGQEEAGGHPPAGPKWSSFEKDVSRFVETSNVREITGVLAQCLQTRGNRRQEDLLIRGLDKYLDEQVEQLARKVVSRLEGVDFVRYLLRSRQPLLLGLGLDLVTRFLSDGLQDELTDIWLDDRLDEETRRRARGYLSMDRRRALLAGRTREVTHDDDD